MIGIVADQIVTDVARRGADRGGRARPSRIRRATSRRSPSSSATSAPGESGSASCAGFGLERGALASTVAHDAHNIVVVGVDDHDMRRAVRRLVETGGGVVVVDEGGVRAELRAAVAGLLSTAPLDEVVAASRGLRRGRATSSVARSPRPFQTLAFLALSVIPSSRSPTAGSSTSTASSSSRSRSRPMTTLYRNAWVVTMDDAGTEHRDGWMLVDDGFVEQRRRRRAARGGRDGRPRRRARHARASSTPTTTSTRRSRALARRRPTSSPG